MINYDGNNALNHHDIERILINGLGITTESPDFIRDIRLNVSEIYSAIS